MLTKSQYEAFRREAEKAGIQGSFSFDGKSDILTLQAGREGGGAACLSYHLFLDQGYVLCAEEKGENCPVRAYPLPGCGIHPDIAEKPVGTSFPALLLKILDACERADGYPTFVEVLYL